ncbi:MAG: hypothetical protein IAB19_00270 [Proteobacteria bacterium]|uniref:AAA+ ATPase domain-containing protein n=1 Tax=Candidatus Avisuccinivibrio stercorigallinarum TaxID=2840704 RepID=A0A9D9GSG4_9GAMM|nr:hypothetical protein [Candidatus Avisuccinivibrio stercorigallinarum]
MEQLKKTSAAAAQQALDFKLDEGSYFSSLIPGSNAPAISLLRDALQRGQNELFYIFGPRGCGKSHLLTALFRDVQRPSPEIFFIDLKAAKKLSPELLNIEVPPVLLLDNVDAPAGDSQWELALFALFNRWVDRHSGTFIASASCSADRIPFAMHDLNTRFENGVSLPLQPLNDQECEQALILKAHLRGIKMSPKVAAFLVRHLNRDMHRLTAVLNLLDHETLRQQHMLTVQFVKKILAQSAYEV